MHIAWNITKLFEKRKKRVVNHITSFQFLCKIKTHTNQLTTKHFQVVCRIVTVSILRLPYPINTTEESVIYSILNFECSYHIQSAITCASHTVLALLLYNNIYCIYIQCIYRFRSSWIYNVHTFEFEYWTFVCWSVIRNFPSIKVISSYQKIQYNIKSTLT